MKRHQLFSIFAAPIDTYYPQKENVITNIGWGATQTAADSVFNVGTSDAIIRSIFIPPTTVTSAPWPVVEVLDAAGQNMFRYVLSNQVSGDILLGPDGIRAPGGFSVEVSGAAGGYIAIAYDVG